MFAHEFVQKQIKSSNLLSKPIRPKNLTSNLSKALNCDLTKPPLPLISPSGFDFHSVKQATRSQFCSMSHQKVLLLVDNQLFLFLTITCPLNSIFSFSYRQCNFPYRRQKSLTSANPDSFRDNQKWLNMNSWKQKPTSRCRHFESRKNTRDQVGLWPVAIKYDKSFLKQFVKVILQILCWFTIF